MADIASPRHPSHCKAIRQQILQYSHFYNVINCTVVLLPDGPTMPRWQEPTSPVHSSHFTGSWVAIQHRGEQSLGRSISHTISSRRSALRDAGYIFQVAHASLYHILVRHTSNTTQLLAFLVITTVLPSLSLVLQVNT